MRLLYTVISIIITTLVLLTIGQACSQNTRFSSVSTFLSAIKNEASGNGGTYDGKIRVLHHYVEDFTCEGKTRPESILMRDQNLKWTLIRNTAEKCAYVNRVEATPVDYDEVKNQAIYDDQIYVPPRDYFVSANEDPNLPGVNLDTGVCEDINGNCSLRAALDVTSISSITAPVVIHIPAGHYKLTTTVELTGIYSNAKPVKIRGADSEATILDGTLTAAPITVSRSHSSALVSVENLTIQYGMATGNSSWYGAALALTSTFSGASEITNCIIKGNTGGAAIVVRDNQPIHIRKSNFIGNITSVMSWGAPMLIEDSNFLSNSSGVLAFYGKLGIVIKSSTFSKNNARAIEIASCKNCLLENLTVESNGSAGVIVSTFSSDPYEPSYDFTITNSTIFGNGLWNEENLILNFYDTKTRLNFNNSVLAKNGPSKTNCFFVKPADALAFVATNSLIDDASCGVLSPPNIMASPRLSLLADNGGLTMTMMPQPGSPLINAGSDALCASADQRGQPHAQCDIGSVEAP